MINSDRLWKNIEKMAEIGKDPRGGMTRLSYSPEIRQACKLARELMEDAGMTVREDAVGNLIGRREGRTEGAPAVVTGSHLDTVYQGGIFDGALGVLAAIEAVKAMEEKSIVTANPIEVVVFADEEGARFSFGMVGSRAMTGTLDESEFDRTDSGGMTLRQAMEEYGLDPRGYRDAIRPAESICSYLELHIEQGNLLESKDNAIGVVSGIAAPLWQSFTLKGQAGHAGTIPMHLRRDAMAAAAGLIGEIIEAASQTGTTVGTVGRLQVSPGGINIIPGEVTFTMDLRDISEETRNGVEKVIQKQAERICTERNIELAVDTMQRMSPVSCSLDIQEAIRKACAELGYPAVSLASGAGHDSMIMAEHWPMGMIFVSSQKGLSHVPEEWSRPEDCTAGTAVLYHTLLELAGGNV